MTEEQKQSNRREVACIVCVRDIVDGEYVKQEGWAPNYILTEEGKKVARANIMGIVLPQESDPTASFSSITIDDGTEKINARSFQDGLPLSGFNPGDAVIVVGRPRQYGEEKYIVPEIVRKIDNLKWLELRKKQIEHDKKNAPKREMEVPVVDQDQVIEETEEVMSNSEIDVLALIGKNDTGNGADIQEVVSQSGSDQAEAIIADLLKKGEIFEVSPGKVKVLS